MKRIRLGTALLLIAIIGLIAALISQEWRARSREARLQAMAEAALLEAERAQVEALQARANSLVAEAQAQQVKADAAKQIQQLGDETGRRRPAADRPTSRAEGQP